MIRFVIEDRFGENRVFLWDKITGSVGILKKGEDINKGYVPEMLELVQKPAYNIGAAELLAHVFLHSSISYGY